MPVPVPHRAPPPGGALTAPAPQRMRRARTRWRRPWIWSSRRCETPSRVSLFHVCFLLVSHPSTVCPAHCVSLLCPSPCPGVAGWSPQPGAGCTPAAPHPGALPWPGLHGAAGQGDGHAAEGEAGRPADRAAHQDQEARAPHRHGGDDAGGRDPHVRGRGADVSISRSGDTPALSAGRGAPRLRKDSGSLEHVRRRITQLGKGLEQKDWLKEL